MGGETGQAGDGGGVVLDFPGPTVLPLLGAIKQQGLIDRVIWASSTPPNDPSVAEALDADWNGKFLINAEFNVLDSTPYYWLALVTIIFVVFLMRRLEHSRVGRAWTAIREDEDAAAIMGVFMYGANSTMMNVMPGDALSTQIIRLLTTITISMAVLMAAAQLLRIEEYGEARDLVLGRLKRIVG